MCWGESIHTIVALNSEVEQGNNKRITCTNLCVTKCIMGGWVGNLDVNSVQLEQILNFLLIVD